MTTIDKGDKNDNRDHRRQEILAILREGVAVSSQSQIVDALAERGILATQSSVSRDLRDLGVWRIGRYYMAPGLEPGEEQAELEDTAAQFLREVRTAGPNLTVVLTAIGAAQTVAIALDRLKWPEIVGTMAGDDTIFVATAGAAEQQRLVKRLQGLLEEER